MRIYFFGHSCFLIEYKNLKLLTDPREISLKKLRKKSLLDKITHVSISHSHFDHSYIKDFDTDVRTLNDFTPFSENNVKIIPFQSYHDNCMGMKRGDNRIFQYFLGDIVLCHLGDLGHLLTPETVDKLGPIDILFIPVGGNITIDGSAACSVVQQLNPKIIIPMHYRTPDFPIPIDGLEKFLYKVNLPIEHKKSLEINSNDLSNLKQQVVILNNV